MLCIVLSSDAVSLPPSLNIQKKKKKRTGDRKANKDKELASSLMVACLKRLLPVGLNLFAGRQQELVQHCKEKLLAVSLAFTYSLMIYVQNSVL